MATLAAQNPAITGTTVTWSAASAGGDNFPGTTRGFLLVKNDDAASHTVTVVIPGSTYGQAQPDVPVTVAAGAVKAIGPFDAVMRDTATNRVSVTYDAVTSVSVAYVELS